MSSSDPVIYSSFLKFIAKKSIQSYQSDAKGVHSLKRRCLRVINYFEHTKAHQPHGTNRVLILFKKNTLKTKNVGMELHEGAICSLM